MQKSKAASLASLPEYQRHAFLDELSDETLAAMPFLWDLWAHPMHQVAPEGEWTTWVILGGRGAGKTRAGAEWIRSRVEGATPDAPGVSRRIALVGETLDQARSVMVEGDSGLLACSPPDRQPRFVATQNKLIWPNGAEGTVMSAQNYEAMRGPQFDAIWADELAKWRYARDAWDMLQFTLRLGDDPRQVVTTTPRDIHVLREVLEDPATVMSHAGTEANAQNLAPGFAERLRVRYAGTWLGRQELDGELIGEREGAMWTRAMIEDGRKAAPGDLTRVVVAVDPPVSTGHNADECGIIVAGLKVEGPVEKWPCWILADRSCQGKSPQAWAERAAAAYEEFGADRLVAEVNQGGDLVENVMRQVAPSISYRAVHARVGKRLRAEPVAALYEQGRVHHAETFPELEDQLCAFEQDGSRRSPDRLDALVWALTDLVVDKRLDRPQVRSI
ncbi:MAG: terminase family protein [Pseudomonadota bacterium]